MIGQQPARCVQFLNDGKEGFEVFRRVQIRRGFIPGVVNLHQRRAAQPVLTATDIDQDQIGIAPVAAQLRSQSAAHVLHRHEGRHDQRQRRDHAFLFAISVPDRFHGQ